MPGTRRRHSAVLGLIQGAGVRHIDARAHQRSERVALAIGLFTGGEGLWQLVLLLALLALLLLHKGELLHSIVIKFGDVDVAGIIDGNARWFAELASAAARAANRSHEDTR